MLGKWALRWIGGSILYFDHRNAPGDWIVYYTYVNGILQFRPSETGGFALINLHPSLGRCDTPPSRGESGRFLAQRRVMQCSARLVWNVAQTSPTVDILPPLARLPAPAPLRVPRRNVLSALKPIYIYI